MAALVRGQSHTSSTNMPTSRDSGSDKHGPAQIGCVCGDTSPSLAVTVKWNLRAPLATLHNSTRAEPRKRRRRCAPPSTHTTCHHQLNPNTYIIPHYTQFPILSRQNIQYELDTTFSAPSHHSSEALASYRYTHPPLSFVLCPLFGGFLAAGSVDSLGSRQLPC